jgi:hypothetical protein
VGSWKCQFANIVHSLAHHPPSQPTITAQFLDKTATGEPYTILIMIIPTELVNAFYFGITENVDVSQLLPQNNGTFPDKKNHLF